MSRKEEIFSCLLTMAEQVDSLNDYIESFSTTLISQQTGFNRSNVSRELNKLLQEAKLIKIDTRPVLFIPAQNKFFNKPEQLFFSSKEDFLRYVEIDSPSMNGNAKQQPITTYLESHPFVKLIGYKNSLKTPVKQAIASIMYPPNGLHTLLIGETGVGKTTFANEMYEFGKKNGHLSKDAPYVVFNCADYAQNSQLLLSHLFGHRKNSFTGADTDKKGLVDAADGGILFLDEIHRLPPEGQEMLFSLMDSGSFRRLGDTAETHSAKVLIICATTEDNAVLTTFLRRIPAVIEIPSLKERTLEERFELIKFFFQREAKKTGKEIIVSSEVLKFLLIYQCKGNVGQLDTDIQLLCANAFVDSMRDVRQTIHIKLSNFSNYYLQIYDEMYQQRGIIHAPIIRNLRGEISFYPTKGTSNPLELSPTEKNNLYKHLENYSKKYFEQGLSHEKIKEIIGEKIVGYLDNSSYENEPIYKIIPRPDYDFLNEALGNTLDQHNLEYDKKTLIGVILHVYNLISRPSITSKLSDKTILETTLYPFHNVAVDFFSIVEKHYKIEISKQEKAFVATLLNTLTNAYNEKKVGILIVTHGNSAAEDLANTANTMLKTNHAHSICMPLQANIYDVYAKVKQKIQTINEGKGVLLLVDMGSLTTFGERVTSETGIPTKTVSMVSTPILIEAVRKALQFNLSVESLASDLDIEINSFTEVPVLSEGDRLMSMISDILCFLDGQKAVEMLNEAYQKITDRLDLRNSKELYVKFIFHSTCMLERAIRKEPLIYPAHKQNLSSYLQSTFLVIKEEVAFIEDAYGIEIAEGETLYLSEIFALELGNI